MNQHAYIITEGPIWSFSIFHVSTYLRSLFVSMHFYRIILVSASYRISHIMHFYLNACVFWISSQCSNGDLNALYRILRFNIPTHIITFIVYYTALQISVSMCTQFSYYIFQTYLTT